MYFLIPHLQLPTPPSLLELVEHLEDVKIVRINQHHNRKPNQSKNSATADVFHNKLHLPQT